MALDVSTFLDDLIDELEEYNNDKYSTEQVIKVTVCGRVKVEGDMKLTLAGSSESNIHVTEGEELKEIADKISRIGADKYSSEVDNNRVAFTSKSKGDMGVSTYDTGETGLTLLMVERSGYECDYDQYFDLDETTTIRKRLKEAMEPFYTAIFDAIKKIQFPSGVIPFVNAVPLTNPTATPASPSVPTTTSLFSTELKKVNMSREGKLTAKWKLKAEAARDAFAVPFESWFLTTVYTIPPHTLDTSAVTAPSPPGTPYTGRNASQVTIQFVPLQSSTLSTLLCTSIGLTDTNAVEYINIICEVLADHINNNWEIGWNTGSIEYSGQSTTAGIATGVSVSVMSNINK